MAKKKETLKYEHGEYVELPIKKVFPNNYNPVVMNPEDERILSDNIKNYGFLAPIIVVPVEVKGEETYYEIVDGEHRFNEARSLGFETIGAIIADPEIFDEKVRKFQNVKLNKVRGHFDIQLFNNLVSDLMENHGVSFDDMIPELGFSDEDEFHQLVSDTRNIVPRAARKEFDRASKGIDSLSELHALVERLWRKYGDTMPANWMILDFGKHRHVMISMSPSSMNTIVDKFRDCLDLGVTVDSVISYLIRTLDVPEFVGQNMHLLTPVTEETGTSLYDAEVDVERD